jgi:Fe-S-cluster containining protein
MSNGDLDKLSRWTRFKPSLCRGCWAGCCRLPVEANVDDLVRLGLVSPDEAVGSLKRVARRLIGSGKVHQYRAATGIFTMAQKPNGDCLFLGNDRLCTVYNQRPDVCRSFPTIGPRPGFCPARKQSPG